MATDLLFTFELPPFLRFQSKPSSTCKTGTLIRLRQGNATSFGIRQRRRRGVVAAAAVPGAGMEELQKGIAELYDESSGLWEDIWGDHMHHGFYDPNVTSSISDHRSAQIRMIEEALRFAGVSGELLSL